MDDSISRQAAIDALNDEFTIIGKTNAIVVQNYIRRINNRLHDLPSAQPERKQGRWIKPGGMMPPEYFGHYECSECGFWAMRDWKHFARGAKLTAYCPNCGAKMEGAEENE